MELISFFQRVLPEELLSQGGLNKREESGDNLEEETQIKQVQAASCTYRALSCRHQITQFVNVPGGQGYLFEAGVPRGQ